jgi:hypothetical protein
MPVYRDPRTGRWSRFPEPVREMTVADWGDATYADVDEDVAIGDLTVPNEAFVARVVEAELQRRANRPLRGVLVEGISLRPPAGLTDDELRRLCRRCADLYDRCGSYRDVARIISRETTVTDKTVQRWAEAGRRLR